MLDFIIAGVKHIFNYLKENFFFLYFVATMGTFVGEVFSRWQKKRKKKKTGAKG
jgi:hypothetical protein